MDNSVRDFRDDFRKDDFDFLELFFKYLFFWKYIVLSILISCFVAFIVTRYSDKIYDTNAKIQILDKRENNLEMPSAADLFSKSQINLENEIQVLKSFPVLREVIINLNLNSYVEQVGKIKSDRVLSYPFRFYSKLANDSNFIEHSYNVKLNENGIEIKNNKNGKKYDFNKYSTLSLTHDLPFEITSVLKSEWIHDSYNICLVSTLQLINELKNSIKLTKLGDESDIISLNLKNTNSTYSENILNELVDVFNADGVRDRQLLHKRTIDFVNDRYEYLANELDSVELNKQNFKINNNLVDLTMNSNISLQKNLESESEFFSNENQIYLVKNIFNEMQNTNSDLLPANIGVDNIEINSLIQSYNTKVLEQKRMITSAGPSNPYLKQLNNSISEIKLNIISSLNNYLKQLNIINEQLSNQLNTIEASVANIPSQEKNLRSIERNQQIKEALYLFLLQKGEEAQVSYAVTEPSIKVVEYAISGSKPIYPRANLNFIYAFIFGLIFPATILFLMFYFDNKVQTREDIEKFGLNVFGEIPFFDLDEKSKVFLNPNDRTIISESFRMLMSNVRYLFQENFKSNVIVVTSSIKGEGKTLNALNLALSFSSVEKKVLLIGCDIRNPQIHKYINIDKNIAGLTEYLVDNKVDWKKNIIKPFNSHSLDLLLSGPLPPNPLNLINNGNIDILIDQARKIYDYVIFDTAPTLLVADTKSLITKVDSVLYVVRTNITDKGILKHILDTTKNIDSSVGVILNGVGQKNSYGYSYGYKYGYGYKYNYSYNYGYGYGYSSDEEKS